MPPAVRAGWETYAANHVSITRNGRSCRSTGYHSFLASLTFRVYGPISGPVYAPQKFARAVLRQPTYAPVGYAYAFASFTLSDPWRSQYQAGIAIFASRPQPVTVNHFTGPFQFVKVSLGSPTTPPMGTAITLTFPATPAKPVVFFRARVIEGDNRLSPPLITRVTFP